MATSPPLYQRIEQQLRRRLAEAADGDPFPAETRLAEEFGVARMTVRAALAALERDGLLERVPGRGSFVRQAAASRPVGTLLSFHDQARAEGKTVRSRVLAASVRPAEPSERAALYGDMVKPPQTVVAISRVRYLDDQPVAIERAAFPASLAPLLDNDLEHGSLHRALRGLGHHPTLGSSLLTARSAGADAGELGVPVGQPMLVEVRTILDQDGKPLEHTESAYVADRFALKVDFTVTAPESDERAT
ncbi:GntR family transcriptional regulator [Glycomyces sp. NPDC048151]|uniref:GntR family transcriptional regulator n=1 Tax=Glycomyces sp. NPDC048151 TaxID=3364002 RepID=UPI00372341D7